MKLPIFVVDAFAEQRFAGNPAAVCVLPSWLLDETLQAIAAENNQPETAFLVPSRINGVDFDLRWFTPTMEVPLCGHATLASGYVLVERLDYHKHRIVFSTRSGELNVERRGELYWVDMPATMPQPLEEPPADLLQGLGKTPELFLATTNKYVALYPDADSILQIVPDMAALGRLTNKGVVVTAAGGAMGVDFVSRYFTPACGVDEDPVTGSAHCLLVPYWAQRLGKERMDALQLSKRRGRLQTALLGERVALGGRVQPYLSGEIIVDLRRPSSGRGTFNRATR